MRYLAIDYGAKRTGVAICDSDETLATPLTVIHGHKHLLKELAEIIRQENAEAIVLGLPLNMDDSESLQTKITLDFAEQLKTHLGMPVYLQDERLSSFDAGQKLAGKFTRAKKKARLDAVAAAAILEAFLNDKKAKES